MAQVSERVPSFEGASTPPDNLICPADEIFDRGVVYDALYDACEKASDEAVLRPEMVRILGTARDTGMARIRTAFEAEPFRADPTIRAYSWLTDCIVAATFHIATTQIHPLPNPTEGERLSVLGVGGYGRGDMAPASDVDLLFLTPYKITPWAESVIESMLYVFWDLHLKVGHASRTVHDCLRLGRDDYTIRTALLEQRYLVGDAALAAELQETLHRDLFKGTARDFIEAKLAERDERHLKQGERYVVEPNVKEGKGGLRDLQSLFWIAKYMFDVRDIDELVRLRVLTQEEFEMFEKAENFLWAVRCHLHLASGRANELLSFDMQVQVAECMGYVDRGGRRAVEHFMQDYFRHATLVGDLTRIFLTKLEATHAKSEPLLERIVQTPPQAQGRLRESSTAASRLRTRTGFFPIPSTFCGCSKKALRTGMLIHPDAMRLVTANLDMIDDAMRNNKDAKRIFLDLLLKHGNPERALRRMNELGVLSAFIP